MILRRNVLLCYRLLGRVRHSSGWISDRFDNYAPPKPHLTNPSSPGRPSTSVEASSIEKPQKPQKSRKTADERTPLSGVRLQNVPSSAWASRRSRLPELHIPTLESTSSDSVQDWVTVEQLEKYYSPLQDRGWGIQRSYFRRPLGFEPAPSLHGTLFVKGAQRQAQFVQEALDILWSQGITADHHSPLLFSVNAGSNSLIALNISAREARHPRDDQSIRSGITMDVLNVAALIQKLHSTKYVPGQAFRDPWTKTKDLYPPGPQLWEHMDLQSRPSVEKPPKFLLHPNSFLPLPSLQSPTNDPHSPILDLLRTTSLSNKHFQEVLPILYSRGWAVRPAGTSHLNFTDKGKMLPVWYPVLPLKKFVGIRDLKLLKETAQKLVDTFKSSNVEGGWLYSIDSYSVDVQLWSKSLSKTQEADEIPAVAPHNLHSALTLEQNIFDQLYESAKDQAGAATNIDQKALPTITILQQPQNYKPESIRDFEKQIHFATHNRWSAGNNAYAEDVKQRLQYVRDCELGGKKKRSRLEFTHHSDPANTFRMKAPFKGNTVLNSLPEPAYSPVARSSKAN